MAELSGRTALREETLKGRIHEIREGIEQRKLPPLLKFSPNSAPQNLRTHLVSNGFVAMDHNPPGMAMRLDGVGDERPFPNDLSIELVGDDEGLREWLSFFTLFEFDMFKVLMESPEVRLYLGRIDGEAIGTSMMFLSSGVAGLYQVEVLPEHRRRGIGTALTLAPMEDARQQGYRIAVLQASAMGEPVYRKIGFKSYFRYNYCHPRGCTFAKFMAA